ncbi:MAG: HAD family hydrolase [Muribaculaceae bacterium]|nr:HAD family hydrolase [Muribaculaceae bacterium]
MTKVVGFDLDDTLVAEALFLKSGIYHIASWLHEKYPLIPNLRIASAMMTAVLTHSNHYSALERLLEEYHLSKEVDMKIVVEKFRSHFPDSSIYRIPPSMISLLEDLKSNPDIRTVLITDGRSLTQRNKIKAARLNKYFDNDDIFISEETGMDKTKPDIFIRVMEKYAGVSEFHYIGDNPAKDLIHPSKIGWKTHLVHRFPLMIHQGIPK